MNLLRAWSEPFRGRQTGKPKEANEESRGTGLLEIQRDIRQKEEILQKQGYKQMMGKNR